MAAKRSRAGSFPSSRSSAGTAPSFPGTPRETAAALAASRSSASTMRSNARVTAGLGCAAAARTTTT